MNRKDFLRGALLSPILLRPQHMDRGLTQSPSIRLLRHATLVVGLSNRQILVDPMLSPREAMDPVQNCGNEQRIPMVDLPLDDHAMQQLLDSVDAIVLTHLHRDHWDEKAQQAIAKHKTIFCQPVDREKIAQLGFTDVRGVETAMAWDGMVIYRTGGHHGTGEIGQRMGPVSGFVLKSGDRSVYVAGDTVWCDDVAQALELHRPQFTVLNTGGAQFLSGNPITMTPADVLAVHQKLPTTSIIAVHMDTVNHCFVRRSDLRAALTKSGILHAVIIPDDGERIAL